MYQVNHQQFTFTIEKHLANLTIAEFFTYFKQSRKKQNQLLQHDLLVNGKKVELTTVLKEKDVISIYQELANDYALAKPYDLELCYEDDLILVCHKPKGMIIHSDDSNELTLDNAVSYHYLTTNQNVLVRHLHRLDRQTSGLVLYCKVPFIQPLLDDLLSKKKIHRAYYAICFHRLPINYKLTINKGIGRHRHEKNKMIISKTGKEAITKIKVIANSKKYSLLDIDLLTGRTHQIRVHLASINHPIVNDDLYGESTNDFSQMGLYAYKLSFINPLTNQQIEIVDKLSPDLFYFKNFSV